jgi:hypothetical protein
MVNTTKEKESSKGSPPRVKSHPQGDGATAETVDSDRGVRLSPQQLRDLSRDLQRLAYEYTGGPEFSELVPHLTSEAYAQSMATGYRVAEDPRRVLLGLARAVKRSAQHRKKAEGRGGSR